MVGRCLAINLYRDGGREGRAVNRPTSSRAAARASVPLMPLTPRPRHHPPPRGPRSRKTRPGERRRLIRGKNDKARRSLGFAPVRSRVGGPENRRFERTGANGSERALAFAMQKVVGTSPNHPPHRTRWRRRDFLRRQARRRQPPGPAVSCQPSRQASLASPRIAPNLPSSARFALCPLSLRRPAFLFGPHMRRLALASSSAEHSAKSRAHCGARTKARRTVRRVASSQAQ